jgi:hypothetical protein
MSNKIWIFTDIGIIQIKCFKKCKCEADQLHVGRHRVKGQVRLNPHSTPAQEGGMWSPPSPGRFNFGKQIRYPSYRRLLGPQSRSRWFRKLSPNGVRTPKHPVCSDSLHRCYPSHIKKMYKVQFHKERCAYHDSHQSLIYVNMKSIRLSAWHRPWRCLLSLRAYAAVAVKISKRINIITRSMAATLPFLKRCSKIPYPHKLLKLRSI